MKVSELFESDDLSSQVKGAITAAFGSVGLDMIDRAIRVTRIGKRVYFSIAKIFKPLPIDFFQNVVDSDEIQQRFERLKNNRPDVRKFEEGMTTAIASLKDLGLKEIDIKKNADYLPGSPGDVMVWDMFADNLAASRDVKMVSLSPDEWDSLDKSIIKPETQRTDIHVSFGFKLDDYYP